MRKFLVLLLSSLAFLATPVFADDIGVGKDSAASTAMFSTDDDIGVGSWYELLLSWMESEDE